MTKHVTATELALYYNGKLGDMETKRVRLHLEKCDACAEVYELVRVPLDDLRAGRLYRLSDRQFRHLWKRVTEAEKAIYDEEDVFVLDALHPRPARFNGIPLPSYATTAPGGCTDKLKASIWLEDGSQEGDIEVDTYIDTDNSGLMVIHVHILGRIEELNGKEVYVKIGTDPNGDELGPAKLKVAHDEYGTFLQAELRQDNHETGHSRHKQSENVSLSVRIQK